MHILSSIKQKFDSHFLGITSANTCHISTSVIEFRDFLNDFYDIKVSNSVVMYSLEQFIIHNNYLEIDCYLCYKYFYKSLGFNSSDEYKKWRVTLIDLVKRR